MHMLLRVVAVMLSVSCTDANKPADANMPIAGTGAPPSEAGVPLEDAGPPCGTTGDQVTLRSGSGLENCEQIRGSLHVPDWFEPALPLQRLRGVEERLTIFRPHHLRDLKGLAHLEKVGDLFSIRLDNSGELVSLDGLESLRELGSLVIEVNFGLASLRGLSGLTTVHGDLTVRDNPALPTTEIDALLSHVKVEGAIQVTGNTP